MMATDWENPFALHYFFRGKTNKQDWENLEVEFDFEGYTETFWKINKNHSTKCQLSLQTEAFAFDMAY